MTSITWQKKHFKDLSINELYKLMALRQEVFIVEQDCPYLDADEWDFDCHHLLAYPQLDELGAYARIVPPKVCFEEVSIGRILTASTYRGTGLGKKLMQESFAYVKHLYGDVPIRIAAQYYLLNFYEGFGFKQVSSLYLEDMIPHVEMVRA